MISVGDMPYLELQTILEERSKVPKKQAVLMVETLKQLRLYRSSSNVLAGKESVITVRDLLKWAHRLIACGRMDIKTVALEGYLLLAERSRNITDKKHIKIVIESIFSSKERKITVDEEEFYSEYYNETLRKHFLNTGMIATHTL